MPPLGMSREMINRTSNLLWYTPLTLQSLLIQQISLQDRKLREKPVIDSTQERILTQYFENDNIIVLCIVYLVFQH